MTDQSATVAPQWQVGDTWRVQYGVKVPSPAMSASATPPPPRVTTWRYAVVHESEDALQIEATLEGGSEQILMTYARESLRLESVVRKTDDGKEAIVELDEEKPYFGWTQSQALIFDWPLFSAAVAGNTLTFTTESDELVEQSASRRDDGLLEILFTARDPDAPETVRSRQTWQPGAPWWQDARISVEYADEDPPVIVVMIVGRRI